MDEGMRRPGATDNYHRDGDGCWQQAPSSSFLSGEPDGLWFLGGSDGWQTSSYLADNYVPDSYHSGTWQEYFYGDAGHSVVVTCSQYDYYD